MWIPAVTDRTREDVDFARAHRNDGVLCKGAQNYADWNRLATNLRHVALLLSYYGAAVTIAGRADWKAGDLWFRSDVDQYRADMEALRYALYGFHSYAARDWAALNQTWAQVDSRGQNAVNFFSNNSVPALPYTHFEKINELERLAIELRDLASNVHRRARISGTFRAGQAVCPPRIVVFREEDMTFCDWDALYRTYAEIDAEKKTAENYFKRA